MYRGTYAKAFYVSESYKEKICGVVLAELTVWPICIRWCLCLGHFPQCTLMIHSVPVQYQTF